MSPEASTEAIDPLPDGPVILVIDDDPLLGKLVEACLDFKGRRHGDHCALAGRGPNQVRQGPGPCGARPAAPRRRRARPAPQLATYYPNVPIVVFSALDDAAEPSGLDHIVDKSDIATLVEILDLTVRDLIREPSPRPASQPIHSRRAGDTGGSAARMLWWQTRSSTRPRFSGLGDEPPLPGCWPRSSWRWCAGAAVVGRRGPAGPGAALDRHRPADRARLLGVRPGHRAADGPGAADRRGRWAPTAPWCGTAGRPPARSSCWPCTWSRPLGYAAADHAGAAHELANLVTTYPDMITATVAAALAGPGHAQLDPGPAPARARSRRGCSATGTSTRPCSWPSATSSPTDPASCTPRWPPWCGRGCTCRGVHGDLVPRWPCRPGAWPATRCGSPRCTPRRRGRPASRWPGRASSLRRQGRPAPEASGSSPATVGGSRTPTRCRPGPPTTAGASRSWPRATAPATRSTLTAGTRALVSGVHGNLTAAGPPRQPGGAHRRRQRHRPAAGRCSRTFPPRSTPGCSTAPGRPRRSCWPRELDRWPRPRAPGRLLDRAHATSTTHLDVLTPSALARAVPDLAERDAYVCGTKGFVDRVEGRCAPLGVARARIHTGTLRPLSRSRHVRRPPPPSSCRRRPTWLLHAQGVIDPGAAAAGHPATPARRRSHDHAGGHHPARPARRPRRRVRVGAPATTTAPGGDRPAGSSTVDGPVEDTRWGPVQVEVVIQGHRMIDVRGDPVPERAQPLGRHQQPGAADPARRGHRRPERQDRLR